ncbi:hypothetical protein BgiBS90_015332 [Biomphalaria glabrata]|uniref:Uncharacterized protein n=1 Tax=Biomphalaria glabrata TaxID=6526 RepID=A0A2C9K973_BIOGL|nr:hypothetical protein BgiBS90_015332 [Biomphalaria glabrata]
MSPMHQLALLYLCLSFFASYTAITSASLFTHRQQRTQEWVPEDANNIIDENSSDNVGQEGRQRSLGRIWKLLRHLETRDAQLSHRDIERQSLRRDATNDSDDAVEKVTEIHLNKRQPLWEMTGIDVVSQIIREIEKQERQREMMLKG